MPKPSPITETPMPQLRDAPNMESATHPLVRHLEKYAVPRFSTTSDRNNHFNTISRSPGMLCYVNSRSTYQVWNGDEWIDIQEFLNVRTYRDYRAESLNTDSSGFTKIIEIETLPPGAWKVECQIFFHWNDSSNAPEDDESVIFTMRHNSSAVDFSRLMGLMWDPEHSSDKDIRTYHQTRGSAEYEMAAGLTDSTADTNGATFHGFILVTDETPLSIEGRKNFSGGGDVGYLPGSYLLCERLD